MFPDGDRSEKGAGMLKSMTEAEIFNKIGRSSVGDVHFLNKKGV